MPQLEPKPGPKPEFVSRRRFERERQARLQAEKLLEEKAKQLFDAQKARDRFLKNINHEFRTPLNGIIAPAQLLQNLEQTEDISALGRVIEKSAQDLLHLVDALVQAARAEPQGPSETTSEGVEEQDIAAGAPLVLIADDHAVNRLVAKAAINAIGMRTILAENGSDAIERIQTERPCAVVMDIQMPVMDGREAIKAIRGSDQAWRRIPIIVLTADAEPGGEDHYRSLGADGYLTKPMNVTALQKVLTRIVNDVMQTVAK